MLPDKSTYLAVIGCCAHSIAHAELDTMKQFQHQHRVRTARLEHNVLAAPHTVSMLLLNPFLTYTQVPFQLCIRVPRLHRFVYESSHET